MDMQLTQDQGIALLRKLANDDAFRASFESDPAAAMAGIGISQQTLDSLDSECLEQRTLAPKSVFEALLGNVDSEEFQLAMSMHVHTLNIG
jgi:putative modified peptide